MKKSRKISGMILALALAFHFSLAVFAADPYNNYGSQSGNISVQSYSSSYNSTWVGYLDNGRAAWNNSTANVTISTSSSSSNTIQAAQYADSWYGLCTQTYNTSTGYTTQFTIQINARTIAADATNNANFAKSTIAHEFGHVFWLCDNPSTTSSSLMKYTRDRNTLTTPQTFDINNVNAKY